GGMEGGSRSERMRHWIGSTRWRWMRSRSTPSRSKDVTARWQNRVIQGIYRALRNYKACTSMDCAGAGDWDRTSDLRFTNYFPTSRNLATPHRLREGRDAPTATACHVSATSQPRRSLNSLHDGATPRRAPQWGCSKAGRCSDMRHSNLKARPTIHATVLHPENYQPLVGYRRGVFHRPPSCIFDCR